MAHSTSAKDPGVAPGESATGVTRADRGDTRQPLSTRGRKPAGAGDGQAPRRNAPAPAGQRAASRCGTGCGGTAPCC